MTPGQHTFQVRAIDEAGNVGAARQPHLHGRRHQGAGHVDHRSADGDDHQHDGDVHVHGQRRRHRAGRPDLRVQARHRLVRSRARRPKTYPGLAVGPHTFQVRATDAAGNVDGSPASYSWTIQEPAPTPDTTAPETTISAQPPATTTETNASFAFAGTDNVTPAGSLTFECKLDTGAYAACTSPKTYTGLAIGSHTFSVRAKDAAGNVDGSPASYTWTIQSPTVNCGAQQTLTANARRLDRLRQHRGEQGLRLDPQGHVQERRQPACPRPVQPADDAAGLLGRERDAAHVREVGRERPHAAGPPARRLLDRGRRDVGEPAGDDGQRRDDGSGTGYREWNVAGMVQAHVHGREQRLPRPRREREPGRRAAVPQPRGEHQPAAARPQASAPAPRRTACPTRSSPAPRRRRLRAPRRRSPSRGPTTRRRPAA